MAGQQWICAWVYTGAFILNAGLGKRNMSPERATGLKGMAATGLPPLDPIEPAIFAQYAREEQVGFLKE